MSKKLFGAFLAAACSAGMVMSAYAIDADEVLQNYLDAAGSVNEMTATVEGVADVQVALPDQDLSFGVSAEMDMDMAVTVEPLAAEVDASMSADVLGEGGEYAFKMYMTSDEDGNIPIYIGMESEDGESVEWALTTIDGEMAQQIQDAIAGGADAQLTSLPIDFTLAEENVDVEGTESYALVSTLTWEDMIAIYNEAIAQVGDALPTDELPDEETLEMLGSLLSGLQVNVEIDVATDSYLPTRARIDLDGSDWVTLGATIAAVAGMTNDDGSLMSLNLNVEDLYLEYLYDYSEPVSIEIPQEVIDNATDLGSASELSESAGEMMEGFESEVG